MIALQTAWAFWGAALLLSLLPGPDNLFVLSFSAMRGARAGLWVVAGLCSGLVVHTLAVALGLSAVLLAWPAALGAIKLAGAAYLLWLAWGAVRACAGDDAQQRALQPMRPAQAWRRGLWMNLSNPKVAVFFLAFLPQFVQLERGSPALQMLSLGALFVLAALPVFAALALAAGRAGSLLQRWQVAQKALNWGAAAVFVALAVRLLW